MQLHPVKLNINVSERYYPQIKEGTKANVYLDIYPDEVFEAVLSRVYPTVDPSTRTFMSELVIQNRDEKLRPGMFARLELELDEMNSFVVPAITVLQQSGTNKRFVFVNEGGEARKIMVTIGQRMDDKIEVISDEISEGVQLIVSGQANLTDGAEIKIIN
jgi:RND family efflux transporter MFP subunit